MKDSHLIDLQKILIGKLDYFTFFFIFSLDLHALKPQDVRPYVKKIKEEYNKRIKKNPINPYANIEVFKLQ